ncbi:MAG: VCBS repeat-containing protein, partial [Gemmatimonadetes bacterium]|nr:VCBS repeat-containing protein [Gemmatimonadota bacterium]
MIRPARYWRLLLVALAAACGSELAPWHEEHGHRWRALDVPRRGDVGFTLVSESRTGISFTNALVEADLLQNQHLPNGSGVALGDVDGDGWVDVYFTRLTGPNALYRNLGNWRFEDITDRAGVAAADRYSTGTVLADVDGDGDLDLLVTALGGPNALFVNDGTGTFSERSDAGLASTYGSHSLTMADIDADGDLDLYITNYKFKSVKDLFPPDQRVFDRVVQQDGDTYTVVPSFREHYRIGRQGDRLARIEIGEPDVLYLNDGAGRFEAVSFTSGRFLDEDGNPLREPLAEWGLTARFYDVDGDGDPDLYVCNDFESVDRLWLNDGAGRFRLAPRLALRSTSHSSMAVDFSDVDRDGDVDFLLVDMLSRDSRRRRTQSQPVTPEVPQVGVFDDRQQKQRNTLFLNRGDGTYAEVAHIAGVAASGWSWGTLFMDVDLDGYEDVLISTGNLFDVLDSGTQARGARRSRAADLLRFPPLLLRNVAFRNRGGFTFEEVGERWGFGTEEDVSHGIASADLDGDGDLDVVLNRFGAPAAVLRNDASAGRIAVRLRGEAPNTQGVGSKIRVSGGPVAEQIKEVTVGGMYLSGSDQLYTFATGDADELQVVVDWRSGRRSVVSGVRPNRLYEIREPDVEPGEGAGGDRLLRVSPFFVDATADLGHVHVEREYDDFIRQPLLPNRLSQLGPGVTWYDLDRDGDEDLLITSGKGGRLAYYRNDGGRFTDVPIRMPEAFLDQTTVLPLRGVGGDVSLLVGQMNYEAVSPAAARDAAAVLRIDAGVAGYRSAAVRPRTSTAVSGAISAVGPLALADYDGDGDLDLFVGGRVLTARYPIAASSRLLLNDGGTFRVDGGNNRAFTSIGLVSAALFSDIDADGDPDLILAME